MSLTSIPQKFCPAGKHYYAAVFNSCPTHKKQQRLYNIRIKTKYYNLVKPDGSRTNEWTFQQWGSTRSEAFRTVIDAIFGGKEAAERFVQEYEVWVASKPGAEQDLMDPRVKWRGTAE